ncbi:hypothetical protein D352_01601 [Enterococcus faecium LA4B-2]|nr:hypothetical protein D352_01601 [Enterococcus faecium LA4B-2]
MKIIAETESLKGFVEAWQKEECCTPYVVGLVTCRDTINDR